MDTIKKTAHFGEKYALAKYDAICEAAKDAAVFGRALPSNAIRIRLYIKIYNEYQAHLDSILEELHKAVDKLQGDPIYDHICLVQSLRGIGFPSAVVLIAEMGSFGLFSSPKKLYAYFGLDPGVNDSGKFHGDRVHMSKRGSSLARRILHMTAINNLKVDKGTKAMRLFCFVDFDGGKLSSGGGVLLIKEFLHTLGIENLLKSNFKTNDPALFRIHKDDENLLQMIYQIFGTYYEDNCADELRRDPILSAVPGKKALASQPTLSRFFNRMDNDTLRQSDSIMQLLRQKVYSIKMPEFVLFDIDTTLLPTYGKQEGEGFNYHYQAHGYHPLLCYDGLTGGLVRAQLRDGTKDAAAFMEPVIAEYRKTILAYSFMPGGTAVLPHRICMIFLRTMMSGMQSDSRSTKRC